MKDLRYPIGKFEWSGGINLEQRRRMIDIIEATPNMVQVAVGNLNEEQLDTAYRPGGWTVRQVVHHLPDSHMNAYIRFKLALTEEEPTIKPYREERWAALHDSFGTPIETSLTLLRTLHERWTVLLRSMAPEDFARTFRHPERNNVFPVDWLVACYAWHGPHHVAHITSLIKRMGWE
jgi:hypothetical protein